MFKGLMTGAVALGAVLATAAVAQDEGGRYDSPRPISARAESSQSQFLLASSLLDARLSGGERYGAIEDLVLDTQGCQVAALIVSRGEDRLVAVPVKNLTFNYQAQDNLRLNVVVKSNGDRSYPEFSRDQWGDDGQWNSIQQKIQLAGGVNIHGREETARDMDDDYRRPGATRDGADDDYRRPARDEDREDRDMDREYDRDTDVRRSTGQATYVKFSTIRGGDIVNTKGEDVGDVEDILFDSKTGKIENVICSAEGFLGFASARHSVPADQVRLTADKVTLSRTGATGSTRDTARGFEDRDSRGMRDDMDRPTARTGRLELNLRPNQTIEYQVTTTRGQVEVAGWEAEESGPGRDPTVDTRRGLTERWTGSYRIRVDEVNDDGSATLSVTLTPSASRTSGDAGRDSGRDMGRDSASDEESMANRPVRYEVEVASNGSIRSIEPVSSRESRAMNSDMIRTHLALICASPLMGRDLESASKFSMPSNIRVTGAGGHRLQLQKATTGTSTSNTVRFHILNEDGDRIGSCTYLRDKGVLQSFQLDSDEGENQLTIRMQSGMGMDSDTKRWSDPSRDEDRDSKRDDDYRDRGTDRDGDRDYR